MTHDELVAAESLWMQRIFWTYLLGVACLSAGLIYALWARAGKPATARPLAPLVLGAAIGVVLGYLVFGRTAVYRTAVGISAAIADCGVRRAPSVWREHRFEYECLFSEGWWDCGPPCWAERRRQERSSRQPYKGGAAVRRQVPTGTPASGQPASRPQPDATATWDGEYPVGYPDRAVFMSAIVAKVRVAEVYPVRANSETGIVPTRDPLLPPGSNGPALEKRLCVPIRLDVIEYLKRAADPSPTPRSFLTYQYAGTSADFDSMPAEKLPGYQVDPLNLSEGDVAVAFLSPLGEYPSWAIADHVRGLAERPSSAVTETLAVTVFDWFAYADTRGESLLGGSMPIVEFERKVATAVATQAR